MTYTSHGHFIPGSWPIGEKQPATSARCGGLLLCSECVREAVAEGWKPPSDANHTMRELYTQVTESNEITALVSDFEIDVEDAPVVEVGLTHDILEELGRQLNSVTHDILEELGRQLNSVTLRLKKNNEELEESSRKRVEIDSRHYELVREGARLKALGDAIMVVVKNYGEMDK